MHFCWIIEEFRCVLLFNKKQQSVVLALQSFSINHNFPLRMRGVWADAKNVKDETKKNTCNVLLKKEDFAQDRPGQNLSMKFFEIRFNIYALYAAQ